MPEIDKLMVRVAGLSKVYRPDKRASNEIVACDEVDAEVAQQEIVAVMGPSGSGKSTLLHLIGALDAPDKGTIEVDGQQITALTSRKLAVYRRSVGFVFQRFHLLPTLTAQDNVMAPLLPYRVGFDKADRACDLLAAVGLGGREKALPSKLSGGQQQRVAIARALVNDPPLLLADEPTGNLDSHTGDEIIELLFGLRQRRGTTMMIATHDAGLAERCDRTIHVRDGRVVWPEVD